MPGMYAYGSIELDRPRARAVPNSATVQIGNRICCYVVTNGKAMRTQIQTGISDGTWTEVVKHATYPTNGEPGSWKDFDGTEQVIVGDLSEMADGKQVAVAPSEPTKGTQLSKMSTSPGSQNVSQSHANPG